MVALHTGLRQGELLALRWEDLDLEAHTLQVRRTVTKDGGKLAVGPTKTAKGRRTVKLTKEPPCPSEATWRASWRRLTC